jgi:hypothetical protein
LTQNVENIFLTGNSDPVFINGNYVWGNPLGWKNLMDHCQGDNAFDYWSDCGIVACENVLIQSELIKPKDNFYNQQYLDIDTFSFVQGNTDKEETDLVKYAINQDFCDCSNQFPYYNGGTTVLDQINILEGNGVSAHYEFLTLENLGEYIKNNHCVIAEIDANVIWSGSSSGMINHAVVVTGAAYDQRGNDLTGFYICDSGTQGIPQFVDDTDKNGIYNDDAAKFISYDLMAEAFYYFQDSDTYSCYGLSVITDYSVKGYLDNINGTGNGASNNITGNAGDNKLDGKSGSDIIYGKGGDDLLIGGKGNDILYGGFGNDKYEFCSGDGIDTLCEESGIDSIIIKTKINSISMNWTNNDLIINYGRGDKITVKDQISNPVEFIYIYDINNYYLSASQITNVIQQISGWAPQNSSRIAQTNEQQYNIDLTPYLANCWKTCA